MLTGLNLIEAIGVGAYYGAGMEFSVGGGKIGSLRGRRGLSRRLSFHDCPNPSDELVWTVDGAEDYLMSG